MYTILKFLSTSKLRNNAISNIKIQQKLNNLALNTGIIMGDDKTSTNSTIVKVHPNESTH